ncbi:hypothetical protein CIPAW_10G003800 [Carya illinoinensis]|uniref:Uncharacterized protein n=1 Tax=Carya illinoinensis TaxID=32201 RepID=A0A8T1P910_CARIL|nr:hypothetical protein CIPAW_10G003800 [Carya illinoinensis]
MINRSEAAETDISPFRAFTDIDARRYTERKRGRAREGDGGSALDWVHDDGIGKDGVYTKRGAAGVRLADFVWDDRELPMVLLLMTEETHRILKTKTGSHLKLKA